MIEADECGITSLRIYDTVRRHGPQTAYFVDTFTLLLIVYI